MNQTQRSAGASAAADPIEYRLCAECARQGRTCCQRHDIYVTPGDCRRIWLSSGQTDFFEYRPCEEASYADQADDPLWRRYVFRLDGKRRVLKWCSGGKCHFLSGHGCNLPLSVRPLVCRLYPHVYTAGGIGDAWDSLCPATRQAPVETLRQGIAGIDDHQARRWHITLYKEILWEGHDDEHRPYL